MRSGDRPGLQNRRAASTMSPVCSTHTRFRQDPENKKAVGRAVTRLTAGKSVAMLPYYAGKKSSELLPPMSTVRSTSAMRPTATSM